MALYLGNNEKLKIIINNTTYSVQLFSETPIFNGARLLSSEKLYLKDSNGIYLTVKEDN